MLHPRALILPPALSAILMVAASAHAQQTSFTPLPQSALSPAETGDSVWVSPEADFSQYSSVYVEPIDIAYKDVDPQVTLDGDTQAEVNSAFRQEIAAALAGPEGYQLTLSEGPGVLSVRIALRDVVVPPSTWGDDAGSVAFMSHGGEMTMALVVRDGGTGANLATASNRMSEDDVSTGVSTTASREAAARTAIAAWSGQLREILLGA